MVSNIHLQTRKWTNSYPNTRTLMQMPCKEYKCMIKIPLFGKVDSSFGGKSCIIYLQCSFNTPNSEMSNIKLTKVQQVINKTSTVDIKSAHPDHRLSFKKFSSYLKIF